MKRKHQKKFARAKNQSLAKVYLHKCTRTTVKTATVSIISIMCSGVRLLSFSTLHFSIRNEKGTHTLCTRKSASPQFRLFAEFNRKFVLFICSTHCHFPYNGSFHITIFSCSSFFFFCIFISFLSRSLSAWPRLPSFLFTKLPVVDYFLCAGFFSSFSF